MAGRKRGLLTVVSILYIILGVVAIIVGLVGVAGGVALASIGYIGLGTAIIILSLIGGAVELWAGIAGVSGKHRHLCNGLATFILIISIITFVLSLVDNGFQWTALFGMVLPILYFVGVKRAFG